MEKSDKERVDEMQERLDDLEKQIDDARDQAEEHDTLIDPDERRFYESGSDPEEDDQEIAPPG
jgi:hypothetical protein